MARWSKFEKRMRERLIEGVEFKTSKRIINAFEGWSIVRFIVKYDGKILINYPQKEDAKREGWLRNYSTASYCAMLMIDHYFSLKHEVAFGMTAKELYTDAINKEEQRRDPGYWNKTYEYTNFIETMADDLLLILKITDRRTGKRSLRKLDVASMKPEFQDIVHARERICCVSNFQRKQG